MRGLLEEPEARCGRQAYRCPENNPPRSGKPPEPRSTLFNKAKNEVLCGSVEREEKENKRDENGGQRNKTPEVNPPVDGRREERREGGKDGKSKPRPDYDTVR